MGKKVADIDRRGFVKAGAFGAAVVGAAALGVLPACSQGPGQSGAQASGEGAVPCSSASASAETASATSSAPYDGYFSPHAAIGRGRGVHPGRVSWAYCPGSVSWNGDGYWWELHHFDEAAVRSLVDAAVMSLAGEGEPAAAWSALFAAHNGVEGYRRGQKVVIKANINGAAEYDDDAEGLSHDSYTNPVLLKCVLASLVEDAGVAPTDITVLDATRIFPRYMRELCTAGNLAGVAFADRSGGADPDRDCAVTWSEPISGSTCFLPTCVTQADYIVNLANMKGHNYGVTLCAKNHFGTIMNDYLFRAPQQAGLHPYLMRDEMAIYNPLVDLMGHAHLGGKTVLYLLDALLCPSENTVAMTPENCTWEQEPFNGAFTQSVIASQDPVAIDSVAADFLANEPMVARFNRNLNAGMENYLHEAALADAAPSGVAYTDGMGNPLAPSCCACRILRASSSGFRARCNRQCRQAGGIGCN